MGTHPIFESDFDCLTEMKLSLVILTSIASAQSFGAVKSKSKTVTVDTSTNPSRKAPNAKMEELKSRAAQGCPHARKQLEEIEKTAEHINTGQDAIKIPSAEEI